MGDDETLSTLVRVSRNYRVKRRELCCPNCGCDVDLKAGLLACRYGCGEEFASLAELAVRE